MSDVSSGNQLLTDESVVYYAQVCCRIKISHADNLALAMASLKPDKLLATEPGGLAVAWKRQQQFEAARVVEGGEWFNETPALVAHIRALVVRHHSAETDSAAERFIPTTSAMIYTGRDRQVLYRWEKEGRITRYKVGGRVLWDVFELPARSAPGSGLPHPAPPPVRR